jgi:ADP-L-glycero-D-manno-heptose 6-epimerase
MKSHPNQRILVTGGAGFIGSALVWALNQRGFEKILIADRIDHPEKQRNIAPLRFEDLISPDDLLTRATERGDRLGEIQTVFHLGACSSTTETDVEYLKRNNYEYTKALAAWALAGNARFIYASSAATYGDGSAGMEDGVEHLDRYRPLNAYGRSKHWFDLYARDHGLFDQIAGLKYFNVFGPNENHKGEMRSLVNKAFGQIQQTGCIKLFKSHSPDHRDGEFGRDFLYIKDAVDMTLHFADSGANGLFNIGSGEVHTWNELARAIFAALDLTPKIEYIDMPEILRERYQYRTQANLQRLRHAGYQKPVTPLKGAVADYVINYLVPGKHLGE